ncbi:Telomerase reverse transcriptase [Coemansia sp. RSA 1200]|nr:Telomerase reverse transcriptase [Coemansia sp. RSA 1200]
MNGVPFSSSFPHVSTLKEYMDTLVINGQCMRGSDSSEFKLFLETTLVGHQGINTRLAFQEPVESITDTALKVIRWAIQLEAGNKRRRLQRNMLAQGYSLCEDGSTNCVKGMRELSSESINSSMVELAKHRWTMLLDRTGTGAVMFLLQKTSMFIPLCNSNYKQICGAPLIKLEPPPPEKIHVPIISSILTIRLLKGKNTTLATATATSTDETQDRGTSKRRKISEASNMSRVSSLSSNVTEALTKDARKKKHMVGKQESTNLTTVVIDRGKMLYSTPRLARGKVRWDLLPDFPLNTCETADDLIKKMFALVPDLVPASSETLQTLCKRMLKLHKRFQYRFHLFKLCPASWQAKGGSASPSQSAVTISDNPFDSDDEAANVDMSNGRTSLRHSNCAVAHPTFDDSQDGFLTMPMSIDRGSSCSCDAQSEKCTPFRRSGPIADYKEGHSSVVDMANTHVQVFSFLQLCVCSVIPRDMIGGKHNHRQMYKALRELVFLGRHDNLLLGRILHRFKHCEAIAWLDPQRANAASIYACVVHWILSEYALQLVRIFFYATEESLHGSKLFYFRNDVWNIISREAWRSLASDMFKPKSLEQAALDGKKPQRFGYSRMRLMPKRNGFRAIANLGQSFVVRKTPHTNSNKQHQGYTEIHIQSTNRVLSDALSVLNSIRKSHPELFGSAVFGPEDMYAKLGKFKDAAKALARHGRSVEFYIAKVDIRRAFDTIPQRRLLDLMREKLPDEEYVVCKYWTLSPAFGRYRKSYLKHAMSSSKSAPFEKLAYSLSKDTRHLVFGDLSETAFVDIRTIGDFMEEHVMQNTVKTAQGLLQQKRGIPQGSVLSSHLCNFFYGQMEHEHLHGVIDREKTIVLRIVDDFLVVSTERAQVATFMDIMYKGIPDYGCEINKTKTLVNFDYSFGGYTVQKAPTRLFPWCGMLVDSYTLDIYADYARQSSGPGVGWTVGLGATKSPGFSLRQKMLALVRSRIHRIYMDSTFNSRQTVIINLFQNFLLCAKKFHVICRRMLVHRNNDGFLTNVIEGAIMLVFTLLRTKCSNKDIPPADIAWLGLVAFRRVLSRKQSRYAGILALLDRRLGQPEFSRVSQRYTRAVSSPLNKDVLSIAY